MTRLRMFLLGTAAGLLAGALGTVFFMRPTPWAAVIPGHYSVDIGAVRKKIAELDEIHQENGLATYAHNRATQEIYDNLSEDELKIVLRGSVIGFTHSDEWYQRWQGDTRSLADELIAANQEAAQNRAQLALAQAAVKRANGRIRELEKELVTAAAEASQYETHIAELKAMIPQQEELDEAGED